MAESDHTTATEAPSLPVSTETKKENVIPIGSKIAELSESRSELLNRIQSLKQDLQNWRTKLDSQVKIYRNTIDSQGQGLKRTELSELKTSLNVEVEQLRSEFQDLRVTLQQQQEDVSASLKNLGLHDVSESTKEAQEEVANIEENCEEERASPEEDDDVNEAH